MTVPDGIRDIRYAVLSAPDRLAAPVLHRLHDDWCAAFRAGALPGHDFIDPVKLHYLLGQLMVVGITETETGARRFHYRLVGTDLVARHGRDATGQWMDEHDDPEVARSGPPACNLVVEAAAPVHITGARMIYGARYPLEYLMLPLSEVAGGMIDRVLIAQIYPADAPRRPYTVE
jgi:hypothetical protein